LGFFGFFGGFWVGGSGPTPNTPLGLLRLALMPLLDFVVPRINS
jgi:hypothetical protein